MCIYIYVYIYIFIYLFTLWVWSNNVVCFTGLFHGGFRASLEDLEVERLLIKGSVWRSAKVEDPSHTSTHPLQIDRHLLYRIRFKPQGDDPLTGPRSR